MLEILHSCHRERGGKKERKAGRWEGIKEGGRNKQEKGRMDLRQDAESGLADRK